MTKGKNYNSIVFLTTLSVYLGLVLVGATPQVLAQAALTRNFDIQSEIEFEDDLDKKPDADEKTDFTGLLENYFGEVEDFIQSLDKLHQSEKFNLHRDIFTVTESEAAPCNFDDETLARSKSLIQLGNQSLFDTLNDTRYRLAPYSSSDCLGEEKFKTKIENSSALEISYDKAELKIEISAFKSSPQRAEQLAGSFNQAFNLYEAREDEPIVKEISKYISFKSENNQVFIVTRLPRGSIDSLLAKRAN